MIWIVYAPTPRHLTSGVMNALVAGGMEATYDEVREKDMKRLSDEDSVEDEKIDPWDYTTMSQKERLNAKNNRYIANKKFYEIKIREFYRPDFVDAYEHKLIKLIGMPLRELPEHKYKIIILTRHPEESRQSEEAMFEKRLYKGHLEYHENYEAMLAALNENLSKRDDMSVAMINARDLARAPKIHFKALAENFGWPIDYEQAAKEIKYEDYRYKIEELDVGIMRGKNKNVLPFVGSMN